MKGEVVLREVARLRAERQSSIIRRSPTLRVDLHDHALVLVPLFIDGDLLGLAFGTIGEKPSVLLRCDPQSKEAERGFFLAFSDVLGEYFARAHDSGSHPQIIVLCDEDIRNFGLLSRALVSYPTEGGQPSERDKIRHLGRLLAYPFIQRKDFPGQQVFVTLTHLIDDHFALPLPESSCWIPSVMAAVFLGQSPSQSVIVHLRQALFDLDISKSTSGSPALEHMISNILRAAVLPLYESLSSCFESISKTFTKRCDHLGRLHEFESSAFNDYMLILMHHLQRLRLQEGATREETASRFLSSWNRPFFRVLHAINYQSAIHDVHALNIVFDPIYRASCRLDGRILVGRVENNTDGLFLILDTELPFWVGSGVKIQGVDGGEGEIDSVLLVSSGYRLKLLWSGPILAIGSTFEFIPLTSIVHDVSVVARRLGKSRSGEPWTHRSDISRPDGVFRPRQDDLISYVESSFS